MLSMEKYFKGYDVPADLRETVTAICNRFAINGQCDPMYIANKIAYVNGFGDGCGHFEKTQNIDGLKTAKQLQGAYACNIMLDEIPELSTILETGVLNIESSLRGLVEFQKRNSYDQKLCAQWRVEYLNRENQFIDRVIKSLTA